MANPPNQTPCYTCDILEGGSQMRSLSSAISHSSSQAIFQSLAVTHRGNARLPVKNISNVDQLCHNCYMRIQRSIELRSNRQAVEMLVVPQKSHRCIVCEGTEDLHDLGILSRTNVFIKTGLYVPPGVKCCIAHFLNDDNLVPEVLGGLFGYKIHTLLDGSEVQRFLVSLRSQIINRDEQRAANVNLLSSDEIRVLTGITKADFFKLYEFTQRQNVSNRVVQHKHLLAFLIKLRQGVSDDFLRVICGYNSRSAVSTIIGNVRKNLMANFVPQFLGLQAHPRQDYINSHVTDFAQTLYNPDTQVKRAIVIVDATYIYIQKSSNYRVLRQSFSVHKGRHLVKPILLVSPKGRILDVHGPYFADGKNNDATILLEEMKKDRSELRNWCHTGDIFIVDRGYRDSLEFLPSIGINAFMPAFTDRGAKQLTYEQANISRYVSITRWKVESRNGHLKNIWKFLANDVQVAHVNHLGDFVRICCALINAFFGPIEGQHETPEFAQRMLEGKQNPNILKLYLEVQGYLTPKHGWTNLNEVKLPQFPRLTPEDLLEITFGIYQINLARSYVQDKIHKEADYCIQVHCDTQQEQDEPGLLRARIYSRFSNRAKYFCYIAYKVPGSEEEAEDEKTRDDRIFGWYCQCKTGARTLGCCAHIASILWYLGYARHEVNVKYPSENLLYNVEDCAHRNMPLVLDPPPLLGSEPIAGPSNN